MVNSLDVPERRQALERRYLALRTLDEADFSWVDVRGISVTGIGFFTDAYQLFAVSFASLIFEDIYGKEYNDDGTFPISLDTAIKIAASVGAVIGQVGFGLLSDLLGRKKIYGVELIIMIVAIFSLSISGSSRNVINIVAVTILWRVILGIGVGGDYPTSSIITSEFAAVARRGTMMASVFAFQGLGQFTAVVVSFICAVCYKNALNMQPSDCSSNADCLAALDKSWRIYIRFTLDIMVDERGAVADATRYRSGRFGPASRNPEPRDRERLVLPQASFRGFLHHFGTWETGQVLLGTAASWLILDVAFYGIGLNSSLILRAIKYVGVDTNLSIYEKYIKFGRGNLILSLGGILPGHVAAILAIDRIGRKPLQIGGFVALTILLCIITFGFDKLHPPALTVLFVLCNFVSNLGPNTTTFIVPGEVFPTRYRSTAYGISAASGKIGAIISEALYGPLRNKGGTDKFVNRIVGIFAVFTFVGIFTSFLIPETNGIPLEQLTGERVTIMFEMQNLNEEDLQNGHSAAEEGWIGVVDK